MKKNALFFSLIALIFLNFFYKNFNSFLKESYQESHSNTFKIQILIKKIKSRINTPPLLFSKLEPKAQS